MDPYWLTGPRIWADITHGDGSWSTALLSSRSIRLLTD